ncbi:PAS domain S-box protein [Halostella sp. PRR32]|uniref:PAS domain S-box protein n=1 Tax=Halostella sp. PRR32 TaxID=3098147 RepID=UPI002B1D121D|nr:PAS domain S-box protein [Halostella sp. PRR32]
MGPSSEANAALRKRVRQQEVVADLGERALETDDLDRLMHDASVAVAETLDTEYCKVLELLPDGDEVLLRQGVGWRDGLVGTETVPTDTDSQAGFTLLSEEPVIVDDLRTEDRFSGPELLTSHDVVSGISVIIGPLEEPWGILGTHTTDCREFTQDDATFVKNVANVLAAAIDRTEKERRLHERERRLKRYKEYSDDIFAAVDDLFYVVDRAGNFQRWNESLNRVTGYSDVEIESMQPLEFVAEPDRDTLANGMAELFETGSSRVEADILTKDGERIPYEFVASGLEAPDGTPVLAGIGRDITDRRERDRELAKYERIVETIDDGIYVVDENGHYTMVNDAYTELTGYTREELLGEHATRIVDEATIERASELRAEMADGNAASPTLATTIRTADGNRVPVEVTFTSLPTDGGQERVGVVRDVTEREKQRRKLEKSERRYRTLVENFPNGAVGLFDENLRYTAVGGGLLDVSSVDSEERIGNSVYDIYPDEIVEEVEPYFNAALDGESHSFETDYHDRHLFAHTLPIRNADDEVFAGMLVVQDVTERREYQRQLEESNKRLEQFAYAASHDLQEPLRMVSSYLQLIETRYGDALDEEGREFLEFAVDGADRMRGMINGLLQYSRVETRGDEFQPVDLTDVLAAVREDLRIKIEGYDAEVTAESLPRVRGDPEQLRQVLQNLLSNAITYSGDEPPRIHVFAERSGAEWTVSVSDEGVGIAPEDQDRIFEVFQRAHSHTEHSGTGIGLALCERIIERHDGEIWVESTPGEGTTVSFTVPDVQEGAND